MKTLVSRRFLVIKVLFHKWYKIIQRNHLLGCKLRNTGIVRLQGDDSIVIYFKELNLSIIAYEINPSFRGRKLSLVDKFKASHRIDFAIKRGVFVSKKFAPCDNHINICSAIVVSYHHYRFACQIYTKMTPMCDHFFSSFHFFLFFVDYRIQSFFFLESISQLLLHTQSFVWG